MPFTMSSNIAVRGRCTSFIFSIITAGDEAEVPTEEYNLNNTAVVKFSFKYSRYNEFLTIFVLHKKQHSALDSTVNLNVSCENLKFSKKYSCMQYLTNNLKIGKTKIPLNQVNRVYLLKINVIVSETKTITFAYLYDDTLLTDFHLSTGEGGVAVHKVCLALHSDTFKTMLQNKWKETEEGCIEMKDFNLQTLQHLKDYIYLRKLPDALGDIGSLLELAKCYLMENLKEDCLMKLATNLSCENLYEYQEYALDNSISEFSRMLLELATDDLVRAALKTLKQINLGRSSEEEVSDSD